MKYRRKQQQQQKINKFSHYFNKFSKKTIEIIIINSKDKGK